MSLIADKDTVDWITPKKKAPTQAANTVTPETNSPNQHWQNRYSLLGYGREEAEEKQEREAEDTENETDVESEDEYDSDSEDEEDNMTSEQHDTLASKMEKHFKPKATPTVIDVLQFKQELIIGLTKCPLIGKRQGHAYLIESIEEYRERSKNPNAIEIVRPIEPIPPTAAERKADKYARSEYKEQVKKYDLSNKYDEQALELIKEAFPGGLDDLKIRGHLPTELTAKEALEHIWKNAETAGTRRACYMEIYARFGPKGRLYKPNANGPRDFFVECEEDLRLAEQLGVKEVDLEQLMISAQEAFWNCGHDTNKLRELEREWKTLKQYHSSVHNKNATMVYAEFKRFYTKKLKELYVDYGKRRGRAYRTEQETDETNERLDMVERHVANLCETQIELAEQVSVNQHSIKESPTSSLGGTTIATDPTYQALLTKLNETEAKYAALEAQIQTNGRNDKTPQAKENQRNTQYRKQLKFYCPTCGVNATHFPQMCRFPNAEHADRLTATRQNPIGGNTVNNHYWLKWTDRNKNVYDAKTGGEPIGKLN